MEKEFCEIDTKGVRSGYQQNSVSKAETSEHLDGRSTW